MALTIVQWCWILACSSLSFLGNPYKLTSQGSHGSPKLSTSCPLHVLDVLYTFSRAGMSRTVPCCPTGLSNKNKRTPFFILLGLIRLASSLHEDNFIGRPRVHNHVEYFLGASTAAPTRLWHHFSFLPDAVVGAFALGKRMSGSKDVIFTSLLPDCLRSFPATPRDTSTVSSLFLRPR